MFPVTDPQNLCCMQTLPGAAQQAGPLGLGLPQALQHRPPRKRAAQQGQDVQVRSGE
jgi:hypothetical protein